MNDKEIAKPDLDGKPPTAYYLIKNTSWIQDQLLYGEAQELLKIPLAEKLKGITLEGGITSLLGEILKSDIAGDVVNLILKQNNTTIWLRIKNRWYGWRNKVDRSDIAKSLALWEVKKVLQDFFYFNITLMMSATGSSLISELAKMISHQQTLSIPSEQKKEDTV
jgi:hypothetical protein